MELPDNKILSRQLHITLFICNYLEQDEALAAESVRT